MNTEKQRLEKLRSLNQKIGAGDPELVEESLAKVEEESFLEGIGESDVEMRIEFESIVMRTKRPVLAIKGNETELVFREREDSTTWKARLAAAGGVLRDAIRAVGRVELSNGAMPWVGTGWLVAPDILVTNRHVAKVFVERRGEALSFKPGKGGGVVGASVDFLQEIDSDEKLSFRLREILDVEREPGPDMAYFRVEVTGTGALAKPIVLSDRAPTLTANAAIIGYPARDSRIPDQDLMTRIYGNVYNKKRLAPGAITALKGTNVLHDCTTLGGNSGSLLLDLKTGRAVGLHFSGSFLTTNYAVRADLVKRRVDELSSGLRRRSSAHTETDRRPAAPPPSRAPRSVERSSPPQGGQTVTVTIPLTVTVSLGAPSNQGHARPQRRALSTAPFVEPDEAAEEATAADYADREGYQSEFLGAAFPVELPTVVRGRDDVLEVDGSEGGELRYEHFSVVMSKSRRMCFLSAVNIDGETSQRTTRGRWRYDPRIPREAQIKDECYGAPPKFSRGHMTRREDPAWGDDETANRGSGDSMHVTNATPQMQAFNAPIWLALEDHALQHARADDMKISVFTGPFFTKNDPVMHGVDIPTSFWKIIAFVHDETGELCATGYVMEQDGQMPSDEFVFGGFFSEQLNRAVQVSIASIEARAGIRFGDLASRDPLAREEESVDGGGIVLAALDQIRFV